MHVRRLSSILISRFILNLRQVNRRSAHHSDASVSFDIQFAMRTRSQRSLPPSLALLAEPVHANTTDPDLMWEHETDMEVKFGVAQDGDIDTRSGSMEGGPSTAIHEDGLPSGRAVINSSGEGGKQGRGA